MIDQPAAGPATGAMDATAGPAAVEIEGFAKSFGAVQAVKGISLRVARGEIFGFLGPNGAGKSTTIRAMLDFIRPTAGTIRLLGLDAQRDTMAIHRRTGYVPGDVRLPHGVTGRQLLDRYSRMQGLQPVLLDRLIERFDVEVDRPLQGYSKGMRQKIALVQAFMCDPELVILDEPTSGLDPISQRAFNSFLLDEARSGRTVFMSSHIMSDVEKTFQRVGVIRTRELVAVERIELPSLKSLNFASIVTSSAGQALYGANISAPSLKTFSGFLSIEFYSVWFGLFFGGFLAFISGGAVARPIEDGTIELALARPFSRRRFYLERCGAMLLVGVIMSLWSLLAVWVTGRIFAAAIVDWHWMLLTQLTGGAFFVLAWGLGALISACSSVARTAGSAALGVLVLGYLLNSLASLSNRLTWLAYLSPFHYAPLSTILVQHQITWWNPVLLAVLGLAGVIGGLIIFERRDLSA